MRKPAFSLRPSGNDATIIAETWNENVYHVTNDTFTGSRVCLDLGANIGAFSLYAAARGAKRVIAYEPDAENFQILKSHLLLGPPGVEFIAMQQAVDRVAGEVDLAGLESWVHIRQEGSIYLATQHAQAVSLEDVFRTHSLAESGVDFLKLDVEGSEYPIFEGAPSEVIGRCRKIAMEFHQTDPETWGRMVFKLMETHKLTTLGKPSVGGGYLWAERY